MPTLHNAIVIEVPPEKVRAAVRDVGALHTRLVPGFVVDTKLEGDVRVVTFGNGLEWTTDLLPHEVASGVQAMQEQGLATMKKTLEAQR
jgi:hypothetical protein